MKKILIITYYWPPKGGVGVQRWLKLTKYLYQNHYKPIIYTPENGVSPLQDKSLLNYIPSDLTILKHKIIEPQKFLSFLGLSKPGSDILLKKPNNIFGRFLIWLRANLFIPDSRFLWIKPSIKFLSNYLQHNPVDVIISTGPPHSMHMIALALKQKNKHIQWIADFRDPWTSIEYFDNLPLLSYVKKQHHKLEKEVMTHANLIISVSPSWEKIFIRMGAKKTYVITNGYDSDDYTNITSNKKIANQPFIIGHFGLYNKLRDHTFFWDTLRKISHADINFSNNLKFLFAGEVHDTFFSKLNEYKFENKIDYSPQLTHDETIRNMMKCNLLLVTQGDTSSVLGRLPAKLFEYIGARRPILAIGKKHSDLEKIISKISYAWFVDFGNIDLLYKTILNIYNMRKEHYNFDDNISIFSREKQAKKLIKLIETL